MGVVGFAVTLAGAAACDKKSGVPAGGGSPSATATASATAAPSAAPAGAAGPTGSGGGDACLQGTWNCALPDSSVAMTITGTSISAVVTAGPMTMDVAAKFTLDGDKFAVEDTGGKLACSAGVVGNYTYKCTATSLSFDKVGDACDGRAKYLACSFSK